MPYTIEDLRLANGKSPFRHRLEKGFDRAIQIRIVVQVSRFEKGNFGHRKPVGDGVLETKCDFGGGVRIYYGIEGDRLVLLLLCGNKSTQVKDILEAKRLWRERKEQGHHA